MQLNLKRLFRRTCFVCFEAGLALLILVILAGGVLAWRLTSAPMDVEFARPMVEEALRDEERGLYVSMDKIVLHWPDLRGPLLLGVRGATLFGAGGQVLLSVDEAALGVNKRALFLGQVKPEELILRKLSLQVIRREDNSFDVGLDMMGPPQPSDGSVEEDTIIERILRVVSADEDARDSSSFSALKRFEIQQARLLVDDRVLGMSWPLPRSNVAFTRVGHGLQVAFDVELPPSVAQNSEPPVLKGTVVLNGDAGGANVDMVLERFYPALLAEKFPELGVLARQDVLAHARLKGTLDRDMNVLDGELALISDAGALNIAELSAVPVVYSDFGFLARYERDSGVLSVPKARITLKDVTFEFGAELSVVKNLVKGPVRLDIAKMSHDDIVSLWPAVLVGDNSEQWIVKKVSGGVFSEVFAQGDFVLAKGDADAGGDAEWSADLEHLVAGFSFDGVDVNYRAPLWPVTGGRGQGRFELDTQMMVIDVEEANLRDMKVSSANLEFIDIIKEGAGNADINLALSGPLESVLSYVAAQPLAVKTDFDAEDARGYVDLRVNVQFPTVDDLPKEAVQVDVRGSMQDLHIPGVVKGLPLSGGPFSVKVEDGQFELDGRGKLDGRDVVLTYQEFLSSEGEAYSSKVRASINADQGLREKFGVDLGILMSGPAALDVVYTVYQGGRAEADVRADLTASKVFVEPFDYEKSSGRQASVQLRAVLKDDVLKEVRDLTFSGPGLNVEKSHLSFRGQDENTELSGGDISRFTLGETVAGVEFEVAKGGRDKTGLVKLVLDGAFLDLRPFLDNEGEEKKVYDGPPMKISVDVERMRTADEETVRSGKMYIDIDRAGKFNQLEVDAVAGAGDIYLRFKPDEAGKRVFRFEADDAGAALKAFDLYKSMRGGKMIVYGEPIRSVFDRSLVGHAQITDFKIVDAPALAQLLGVMSLPGLMQSLNGEGLVFSKMEGDFDWLYRPQGSLLVLKDGRTSGNSLGLTFDGTFDHAAQSLDVSGTIIPLSGINDVISSIPLLGNILTGGTGAFIAATYTMKGEDGGEPDVSVNPLSVLTPGILRRILFEEN